MIIEPIQHQRLSDPLGRYYTASSVGDILISSMRMKNPKYVLDLGAGTGTLSLAASKRWGNAEILSVDIDAYSNEKMNRICIDSKRPFNLRHHIADALGDNLHNILGVPLGGIDISVCNPPYTRPEWTSQMGQILEETGLSCAFDKMRNATSDVLFLAQNLRLLREKGQLGLIVPDGLVAGEKYKRVRKYLIENHDVECCIRLPRGAFKRTDAQAHILVINKGKPQSKNICLRDFDNNSLNDSELLISPEEGVNRLDFGFYFRKENVRKNAIKCTKGAFSGSINRGLKSSSYVKSNDGFVFHTCDFPQINEQLPYVSYKRRPSEKKVEFTSNIVAESGDILLARVHRNLEEKVCIVKRGKFPISDCVFRVRLESGCPIELVTYLKSEEGKDLLKSISSGVSARYISKGMLLDALFEK